MSVLLKIVLLVGLVLIVLGWLRAARKPPPPQPPPSSPGSPPRKAALPAEMVACRRCDLRLPQAEALPGPDGHFYCCEGHRRAGGEHAG